MLSVKMFSCLDSHGKTISKSIFYTVCVLLFFLICLSCVSAHENVSNTLNSDGMVDLDVMINGLSSGDEFSFDRNYTLSGGRAIDIKVDNVTVNGNGYSIDAYSHTGSVFNVYGNNVVFKDLNLIGANQVTYLNELSKESTASSPYYRDFSSPICWYGDNGIIDGCYFSKNCGINGGVLSLYGDNCTVENTIFVNSSALGAGAAFYNNGINNTFANNTFLNSRSSLIDEDFFTDKKMILNWTEGVFYWGMGNSELGLDVNILKYVFPVNFVDTKVNIVPLIYGQLGGLTYCEGLDNVVFVGMYNGSDFRFAVDHQAGDSNNYVVFSLNYVFTNLNSVNDIFTKLSKHDYTCSVMLTKNFVISDLDSYDYARNLVVVDAFDRDVIKACFDIFDKNNADRAYKISSTNVGKLSSFSKLREFDVTFNYNVMFNGAYTFNTRSSWDIGALGYDAVCIEGMGSTICGSAGLKDEYKWATVTGNSFLSVNNLNIKKFNTAIFNCGICLLNHVVFEENKMDYALQRDWGGAIINAGYCLCINCSFVNSYASKGGAIFTQKELSIKNCTFLGNVGYRLGNDVLNVDKGVVYVDDKNITLEDGQSCGFVTYDEGLSLNAITIGSVVASFVAGFGAGFILGGPLGLIGGAILGLAGGLLGSMIINSYVYDVNLNVKEYTLSMISLCVQSGIAGAMIGSMVKESIKQYKEKLLNERKHGEIKFVKSEKVAEGPKAHSQWDKHGYFDNEVPKYNELAADEHGKYIRDCDNNKLYVKKELSTSIDPKLGKYHRVYSTPEGKLVYVDGNPVYYEENGMLVSFNGKTFKPITWGQRFNVIDLPTGSKLPKRINGQGTFQLLKPDNLNFKESTQLFRKAFFFSQ